MKVMIAGPLTDSSGYGIASSRLVKALSGQPGIDLVARAIKYTSGDQDVDPEVMQALSRGRDADNVDFVIEVTHGGEVVPVGRGAKTLAWIFWQTDRVSANWVQNLNALDGVIVSCHANKRALERSGVTVPIFILDVPYFKSQEKPQPLNVPQSFRDCYKFYSIFHMTPKKGFSKLLDAFVRGYTGRHDVCLIVKTHLGFQNRDQREERKKVGQMMQGVFSRYGITHQMLPKIIVDVNQYSDQKIRRLHQTCDCFVLPSYGEGWCLPAQDALMHGNPVIVSGWGGPTEFVKPGVTGALLNVMPQPVSNMDFAGPQMYEPNQNWYVPSSTQLLAAMHAMESERFEPDPDVIDGLSQRFSKQVISEEFVGILRSV